MKDLYIVNCCRTAIGSFGGTLKEVGVKFDRYLDIDQYYLHV